MSKKQLVMSDGRILRLTIPLLVFLVVSVTQVTAQTTDFPYPTDTIKDTVVYRYPAPKSIGIYRISKIFGVSQEDILRWNPQLRDRGPQLDEILLIPAGKAVVKNGTRETPRQPDVEEKHDTHSSNKNVKISEKEENTERAVAKEKPSVQYNGDEEPFVSLTDTSRIWRLAVLLPLNSHSADRDEYNDRFYDFYTGLLTAVYQAQRTGMRLEIHTYDVPRTGNHLRNVLNDPWMETAHAIIGPAYTNQVNKMAAWSKEHPIWMLVPFTSRVAGIAENPYILQFNPTPDRKARCLADTIEQHKDSLHCIYIKADRRPSPEVAYLLQELSELQIEVDTVPLRALMSDSADYAARDSVTNLVILHTDNYTNASVILPHVKQLAIRHDVRLLAQDSWVQQEEIAVLRPVYACFFRQSDKYSSALREYNRLHNHYFSADSAYTPAISYPRFDMLGYDLTRHLLEMLPELYEREAGTDTDTNMDYVVSEPFTKGIQSTVRYVRTGVDGGWINEHIQAVY